jgi:hypothetical protein
MKVKFIEQWRGNGVGQVAELNKGVAILLLARNIVEEVKNGKQVERKKNSKSAGGAGNSRPGKRSPKSVD